MKTLKTIGLLLLTTLGALAQPSPDDMYIDGYVLDANGFAVEGHEVCVAYFSNNPAVPSDTICTTTNPNGWFSLTVVNGSITGPNISFDVYAIDSCSIFPLVQTVDNQQGTVDAATFTFQLCANANPCNASVVMSASNDSTFGANGVWTFFANPQGTPPFTYDWWVDGTSYSTQTVTHVFNGGIVGVYVNITDANGCDAMTGDTLFLDGNQSGCSANIVMLEDSMNAVLNAELTAIASGVAPFTYSWSTGETTETIYLEDIIGLDTICVEITDANGCSSTACDVVGFEPNQGCTVEITTTVDSTATGYVYTLTASGGFVTYDWTYANQLGQTITVQNVSPNGELICVVATTASGCVATSCDTLFPPNNLNCNADFITSANPNAVIEAGDTLAVTYTGSQSQYNYYFWTVQGNGMVMNSFDENPLFVLPTAGTYEVCLIVTDSISNCASSHCETVIAQGGNTGGCDASFTYNATATSHVFTAQSQNPGLYYLWNIDNLVLLEGAGDFQAVASNLSAGAHMVCLTVIDSLNNNCSDSECFTFIVGGNNCNGYISGQVFAGSNNQPLDDGIVYLITFDSASNMLTAIDSMPLDSGNYYFFGPLACGDYLIKAAATPASQYYNGYVPTYYGNSPFWGFAQNVSLSQPNDQQWAEVTLIAANNPGGPGFIGGDVTQGANKFDPGDPLEGMQVMLFDMNGNAIKYMYTDANGDFGFGDLAYGSYQIYVELLGVETAPAYVTIGPEQPSVDDLNIYVSETLISTGITEFDFDAAISEVYPNPVGTDASISFSLEDQAMVNINILDLAGRTIISTKRAISAGDVQIRISVDGLTEGYYFLNIQDMEGAFNVTRKFMRVD